MSTLLEPRREPADLPRRGRWGMRPAVVRELGSLAAAAVRYPFGVTEAADRQLRRILVPAAGPTQGRAPVVLVHGYGGNRSNWLPLQRSLVLAGFHDVHAMSYNPLTHDIPALARMVERDCRQAMACAGVDRVHVVGHSLGGVLLRYAVQQLGLADHVGTAVTIASPHTGTSVARLGRGPVAVALRPGSALLRELTATAGPSPVRWIAYYSDSDLVVPATSARLMEPALAARNVLVPGEGHVSILSAGALLRDLVAGLLSTEADDMVAA